MTHNLKLKTMINSNEDQVSITTYIKSHSNVLKVQKQDLKKLSENASVLDVISEIDNGLAENQIIEPEENMQEGFSSEQQ